MKPHETAYQDLLNIIYGSYKPTDRCLGAGCYSQACTEDWAAKVRREHGERVQFREWVNGK